MFSEIGHHENRPRFKVLVEAYECSPAREHAPGSAWQIVSRLAQWFDVWVLTEEIQYAAEVREYLFDHPELAETLHFHFIPRRKKGGFNRKRPPLPIRETLDYSRWQKDAFLIAQQLHETVRFDLIHHLRSNTFRRPGYIWKLDVPFVWGPMGGTCSVKPGLLSGLNPVSKAQYLIRNVINAVQFRSDRNVRAAIKNSACIFSQTSADQKQLQRVHGRHSILLHEQATSEIKGKFHSYDGGELNIAWVGRCIAGKALHFLLEAVARLKQTKRIQLHIVGAGPALGRWRKQARQLGIEDRCLWYGWVEPEQANEIINNCDMLAFTSILEGTSATVMSAMSHGVPVMTLKHCGMGDVIGEECGFPISIDDPKRIVGRMSTTLENILTRPELIGLKSKNSLELSKAYQWGQMAETIRQAYWNVLGIFHVSQKDFDAMVQSRAIQEVVCS